MSESLRERKRLIGGVFIGVRYRHEHKRISAAPDAAPGSMIAKIVSCAVILVALMPHALYAQGLPEPERRSNEPTFIPIGGADPEGIIDPEDRADPSGLGAPYAPPGTVSCFDHYAFGSVQARLTPAVNTTVSGATMTFSGVLENANDYPVVDGALYVKVFRLRPSDDGNGPDVVDQFFVQDGISIPGRNAVPVSFSWKVPAYARVGDYQLATFFTTNHAFNLLGLSFTDDVVGNGVRFRVESEHGGSVGFDKESITVNGEPYHFAAFPPRTGLDPVVIGAVVRNTTGADQVASIAWDVYQWDAQREENRVQQETASVRVRAGQTEPVSLTVPDARYPVYLAIGTLTFNDTKSIIGVRFVRDGIDRPRINFPSLLSFPLMSGRDNALFSCLHNTSSRTVPGRLELHLTDEAGRTIAEYFYEGDVTGAMMGTLHEFVPAKDYDYAVLTARLYEGDTLVDESRSVYDCEAIDPSSCFPTPSIPLFGFDVPMSILYYIAGAAVFVVIVMLWANMRRGRIEEEAPAVVAPINPSQEQ